MTTQEKSYMTVYGNNDMEIEVDGDMALERCEDNNEEVEVIHLVNECFRSYDGLPKCTNSKQKGHERRTS